MYCVHDGTPISKSEVDGKQLQRSYRPKFVYLFQTCRRRFSLLAWTTTPWTLPANVALAVNPDLTYAVVNMMVKSSCCQRFSKMCFLKKNINRWSTKSHEIAVGG